MIHGRRQEESLCGVGTKEERTKAKVRAKMIKVRMTKEDQPVRGIRSRGRGRDGGTRAKEAKEKEKVKVVLTARTPERGKTAGSSRVGVRTVGITKKASRMNISMARVIGVDAEATERRSAGFASSTRS